MRRRIITTVRNVGQLRVASYAVMVCFSGLGEEQLALVSRMMCRKLLIGMRLSKCLYWMSASKV
eukprot:11136387-Karenia_brevis.AAC.1